MDSKCYECLHRIFIRGRSYGAMEDCYPDEEYCEEESENFLTEDGCWRWEECHDAEF